MFDHDFEYSWDSEKKTNKRGKKWPLSEEKIYLCLREATETALSLGILTIIRAGKKLANDILVGDFSWGVI